MPRPHQFQRADLRRLLILFIGLAFLHSPPAFAVPMLNDPNGFEGIPWGAAFSETADFVLVENSSRVKGYELKAGPPPVGPAHVDAMRFLTIEGQFARVTIRYHGKETHQQIVNYFQSKYGPLDRTPGQVSKGTVQQHNWRGDDTQIILTYDAHRDRGIIFFENPLLATRIEAGMAPESDLGGATY
jgi:hypothetical protein